MSFTKKRKDVPPPGIELGFHRPQRCVLTIILRWHLFLKNLKNIIINNEVNIYILKLSEF